MIGYSVVKILKILMVFELTGIERIKNVICVSLLILHFKKPSRSIHLHAATGNDYLNQTQRFE